MTHDEMIAVIQAHKRGETVQYWSEKRQVWSDCYSNPGWNFFDNKYRIKPKEPREWYVREATLKNNAILQPSEGVMKMKELGLIKVREVIE